MADAGPFREAQQPKGWLVKHFKSLATSYEPLKREYSIVSVSVMVSRR